VLGQVCRVLSTVRSAPGTGLSGAARHGAGMAASDAAVNTYVWRGEPEPLPSKALRHPQSQCGVSTASAWKASRRVSRRGFLGVTQVGRRTDRGLPEEAIRHFVESLAANISVGFGEDARDGARSVVALSPPEDGRPLRSTLPSRSRELGLARLSDGVWATPHPSRGKSAASWTELQIGPTSWERGP
jgi:hypothetical protein